MTTTKGRWYMVEGVLTCPECRMMRVHLKTCPVRAKMVLERKAKSKSSEEGKKL